MKQINDQPGQAAALIAGIKTASKAARGRPASRSELQLHKCCHLHQRPLLYLWPEHGAGAVTCPIQFLAWQMFRKNCMLEHLGNFTGSAGGFPACTGGTARQTERTFWQLWLIDMHCNMVRLLLLCLTASKMCSDISVMQIEIKHRVSDGSGTDRHCCR